MQSYGLKAWDSDHIEEAHSIVTGLAALDEDAAQHEGASQGTKAAK